MPLSVAGFDADDTLWQNEKFFRSTEDRFVQLLGDHATDEEIRSALAQTERRHLSKYGYGIKGFVLSMIETAVDITSASAPAQMIRQIIEFGHEMLSHPVELLPSVQETLVALQRQNQMKKVLISKGDLLDQERKIAQSGLEDLFDEVEIVSEKTPDIYHRIFHNYGAGPEAAIMVGNSVKSDILPAIEAGSWGVHVPHHLEWVWEKEEAPIGHPRYRQINQLSEVICLIEAFDQQSL